jgi:hypothetical protein
MAGLHAWRHSSCQLSIAAAHYIVSTTPHCAHCSVHIAYPSTDCASMFAGVRLAVPGNLGRCRWMADSGCCAMVQSFCSNAALITLYCCTNARGAGAVHKKLQWRTHYTVMLHSFHYKACLRSVQSGKLQWCTHSAAMLHSLHCKVRACGWCNPENNGIGACMKAFPSPVLRPLRASRQRWRRRGGRRRRWRGAFLLSSRRRRRPQRSRPGRPRRQRCAARMPVQRSHAWTRLVSSNQVLEWKACFARRCSGKGLSGCYLSRKRLQEERLRLFLKPESFLAVRQKVLFLGTSCTALKPTGHFFCIRDADLGVWSLFDDQIGSVFHLCSGGGGILRPSCSVAQPALHSCLCLVRPADGAKIYLSICAER